MAYLSILGIPKPQYEDTNGIPYVGMRLFFYEAGTSTKQDTKTDSSGSTNNTNPIVIGADGYPESNVMIFGDVANSYKIIAAPPGTDDPPTSPLWTIDNIYPGTILGLLGGTSIDDGTEGYHLIHRRPLSGEVGVVNYEYPYGHHKRYNAIGLDGTVDESSELQNMFTSCSIIKYDAYVGHGNFKTTTEIDMLKVSMIGDEKNYAQFTPSSAVTRAFKVGGTTGNASGTATVKNIQLNMGNMPADSVGFGSDYGVSSWIFENMDIQTLHATSVIATDNYTAFKFNKTSNSTDAQFYNRFVNVDVSNIAFPFDFSSTWTYRSNDNRFTQCRCFNFLTGFKIYGDANILDECNFSDSVSVAEGWDCMVDIRGNNNTIIGGYPDNSAPATVSWFKVTRATAFLNTINLTSTPGRIQYYDDEAGTVGTLEEFDDKSTAILTSVGDTSQQAFRQEKNLLYNSKFTNWAYGTSSSSPTSVTHVLPGWRGQKNGATFTVSKETTNIFKGPTSLKLDVTVASTGGIAGVSQCLFPDSNPGVDRGLSSESFEGHRFTFFVIAKSTIGGEDFRLIYPGGTTQSDITTSWTVHRTAFDVTHGAGISSFDVGFGLYQDTGTVYVADAFLVIGQYDSLGVIPRLEDNVYKTILGIGHTDIAAATTPGSVVKKEPRYDIDGTLIGYVAIYDAIT